MFFYLIGFYLQNVVSLVFIIGMMLVTSFLVPPESLDARVQITITLFLSAVSIPSKGEEKKSNQTPPLLFRLHSITW